MTEENKVELWSLTALAEKYHVRRQSIFMAIKKSRLFAIKIDGQWRILEADYNAYRGSKYSRDKSMFNGEPLYKAYNKEMSVRQTAKRFGVGEQHIYYLIRTGRIPYEKRGNAIVIKEDHCMQVFNVDEKQRIFL